MANGTVIIESGELRLFVQQLSQFNSSLAAEMSTLGSQFQRLGETWRDPAYASFGDEFEQLVANLKHFEEASEAIIPQMLSLAQRVDAVHNR